MGMVRFLSACAKLDFTDNKDVKEMISRRVENFERGRPGETKREKTPGNGGKRRKKAKKNQKTCGEESVLNGVVFFWGVGLDGVKKGAMIFATNDIHFTGKIIRKI